MLSIFSVFEDKRPVSRWECLISCALNKIQPTKVKYKSYSNPSSPSRYQLSNDTPYFEDALLQDSDSETDEEVHQLVEDSHDFCIVLIVTLLVRVLKIIH
ncbi:hypothetical protein KSP40_PGU018293 [Platanthera guangdongensis]|uniref:Uncharacterized protein n=1 Tax=Platanthera guangdongensis TaxID=2320717 RepID=A0ABR2LKV4_9ASPA